MRILSLLVILLSSYCSIHAQIRINRSWDFNPLAEQVDSDSRVLGSVLYSVEPAHGWLSYEEEQTWTIRNQAFIEFYRWKNDKAIGLYLGQELQSNPFNEIYFNPRAAFWNESLQYHQRLGSSIIKIGANHRCRHNIDNLDPPAPEDSTLYLGEGRILVLTALSLGIVRDEIWIGDVFNLQLFGEGFYYLYTEDSRTPSNESGISWEDMLASLSFGYLIDSDLSNRWMVYQRSSAEYILFQRESNQFNYRVEAGIGFKGDKALLSLFSSYEYFFDESNQIIPTSSELLQLGLRFSSPFFN